MIHSVAGSKCRVNGLFCHLYQKSLNKSLCDTSFFSSKATWEIIWTTESLYDHVDLCGSFREKICPFMKSAGPARRGQTGPSGTPAVCLGSALGLGTGLQLSVATGRRAAGISWLNFSVILFAVILEGGHGNFWERTWIKVTRCHRRKTQMKSQYICFDFYFTSQVW